MCQTGFAAIIARWIADIFYAAILFPPYTQPIYLYGKPASFC
ncbi:hypothetical protein HMPREF1051_2942 [Neisseria sicca VK64]|uniref:Uncharacterized protein n=1 Tax=Neisseria sicca VK64 TaxID=1095748 RepID=I2NVN4_NEISI|nr:hypothetical protein HMPREF1051_2942 [Neisseria sicca VK64]